MNSTSYYRLYVGHIIVVTNMLQLKIHFQTGTAQLFNKCQAVVLNLKWETKQHIKHHATLEEAGQYDAPNAPPSDSPGQLSLESVGVAFSEAHLQVSSWDGEQLGGKRAPFISPWDWWSLGLSTAVNIPKALSEQQSNTHHWQLASPKLQLDHYRLKAYTHTSYFRANIRSHAAQGKKRQFQT